MHARRRICIWLIFGLGFALLPVVLDYIRRLDAGLSHTLRVVCADGKLFLIAAVMGAAAAGDLIFQEVLPKWQIYKIWAAGSLILGVAIEAAWYSDISSRVGSPHPADPGRVKTDSVSMFVVTALASAACVYLTATSSAAMAPAE